ncbi:MAG: substrate-binding domain-containing protein [Cyanobacteria bacterium J06627_32]
MKHNLLCATLFSVTVLIGLPSCGGSTASTNPSALTGAATEREVQTENRITVGGSGTAMRALKVLAAEYGAEEALNFLDSSQASAGILGVKAGQLNIGTVTRAPKSEEAAEGLEHHEFARDAILVATHPSVEGVTQLTSSDLQSIYSGQETNWSAFGGPDAEITVLDRPEDESAKRLLRDHHLGAELSNAPKAVVLRKESELIDAVQATPYSIGAFSLANAITDELPVNHIALNGVKPLSENIDNGTYPMVRTMGMVWFGEPNAETQAFIDYVFSEGGAEVLTDAGMAPTAYGAQ